MNDHLSRLYSRVHVWLGLVSFLFLSRLFFIFTLLTRSLSMIVGISILKDQVFFLSWIEMTRAKKKQGSHRLEIPVGRSVAVFSLFSFCSIFIFLLFEYSFPFFPPFIFYFFEYICFVSVMARKGSKEEEKREKKEKDFLSISIQNVTMDGWLPAPFTWIEMIVTFLENEPVQVEWFPPNINRFNTYILFPVWFHRFHFFSFWWRGGGGSDLIFPIFVWWLFFRNDLFASCSSFIAIDLNTCQREGDQFVKLDGRNEFWCVTTSCRCVRERQRKKTNSHPLCACLPHCKKQNKWDGVTKESGQSTGFPPNTDSVGNCLDFLTRECTSNVLLVVVVFVL